MSWKEKNFATRQDWLDALWKRLVWYFPAPQVREILSDYQEQFEAGRDRGRSETELINSMGSPEDVLNQLLEEEPTARTACLWTNGVWGAALVLCLAFLWVCFSLISHILLWAGSCAFLAAFCAVLFLLLRGPARVELERKFAPDRTVSPVLGYCVPFALTLAFEVTQQICFLLANLGKLPLHIAGLVIGEFNTCVILALEAVLALLAVWLLVRSATVSIRYFPGVVHAIGAMGTIFFTYIYLCFQTISSSFEPSIDLLLRLLPYFEGLAVARIFQKWADGRRPLPFLFQAKAVTRQDWFHRLGVSLLGWFPAGQVIEILEDYREQFELGLERGRSEEELTAELGRPETVVRDLLAEDRKARGRRRRIWPWVVMLIVAGWLLLGVLRAYEWGSIGFLVFYFHPVRVGITALALGTAALSVLLRVRSRAVIETRFPAPRTPTFWIVLAPALACVLSMGFSLFLIRLAFQGDANTPFWGRPVPWYLADITELSVLLLLFLLVWSLARFFSGSIRYLPAAIHAVGGMTSVLCTGIFMSSMDMSCSITKEDSIRGLLPSLLPYLAGILLALAVWLIIRFAGKPGKEG